LDKLLAAALTAADHAITRSALVRAFAAGEVLDATGRPLDKSTTVTGPLDVQVRLPAPEPFVGAFPEQLGLHVWHEDEDVLVVEKPAGMPVHVGPGHDRGTLVNAVLGHLGTTADALPVLEGNPAHRPGLVHRLDRDTSGVMVIAKHARAQEALASQFRVHDLQRVYLAIVQGEPSFERRRIETLHGRDPVDRRRFSPDVREGRRAVTTLRVMERFGCAALLAVELETGRTHQIRMHCRHVGHPIVGDELYGHKLRDPNLREAAAGLHRQALHAAVLGFKHPRTGRIVRFESPLPADMRGVLDALRRQVADRPP
jgi:23S rRNA pseudouridine1911/1915/1917 synthase